MTVDDADHLSSKPNISSALFVKVTAGALIPSFGSVIFNLLDHILTQFQYMTHSQSSVIALPPAPDSVYNIGVGCALSIVGICVACKDRQTTNSLMLLFVGLVFLILSGSLAAAYFDWRPIGPILFTNLVSFIALCWAIVEVD